jgi:hypothetical protein
MKEFCFLYFKEKEPTFYSLGNFLKEKICAWDLLVKRSGTQGST